MTIRNEVKEQKTLTAIRITHSALADHSFKIDHEIEWNNASIITCNPRYFQRIVWRRGILKLLTIH